MKRYKIVNAIGIIWLLLFLQEGCTLKNNDLYSTPEKPWKESFGNHRAVLHVGKPADAVLLDIIWRRHDQHPERKHFFIIDKESGDTIRNIYRIGVNNEHCKLVFGPVKKAGTYYFYYLPYVVMEKWGFYNKGYLPPEDKPDPGWIKQNRLTDDPVLHDLPKAELRGFQSRTAFDSFYPMEIIALKSEKEHLLAMYKDDLLIFPESREFPIRMKDEIPLRWIQNGPSNEFKGVTQRNEYYVFQLGVYAARNDLQDLQVRFSDLTDGKKMIPASRLTCFNTGGVDPYGEHFTKRVNVKKGNVQPLWIGVDIPGDIAPGKYKGSVTVMAENKSPQNVEVTLKVLDRYLADRGDGEPWRYSRLRWLNSTIGIDDEPTRPYQPIRLLNNNTYLLTNKIVEVANNGLPGSLTVKDIDILQSPVSFVVETGNGIVRFSGMRDIKVIKDGSGIKSRSWTAVSKDFLLNGTRVIESDGYMNYKIMLQATKDIAVKDIRLELPLKASVAKYMMGMGLPGTTVPESHSAKWNGPYDSFWIGSAHAGVWCELRGSYYHGPLLNLYHPPYPASWFNDDKGGFRIQHQNGVVKVEVYSGSRNFTKGDKIVFEWSMLLTPVKDIDYTSQFVDRYYHNGSKPMPGEDDLKAGVKIVNLHHGNNYNPYINYPFIAVDSMKWFVHELHNKGLKVKIYYTIRELSDHATELWALRSLGFEILADGRGKGYPWLREHLIENYHPQWYQHYSDKSPDASILNASGDTRWYNYYVEGLAWLVKNVDIDGLYLDDVAYDRRTVKRIRKVLDDLKPGCLIDLHSNTGFSKGPATQYAEYFPYLDKLWFGESFNYDKMSPANWLVEVSGIPFGLMGDMLQGGGNRWLGMLFGMTVRYPWVTEGVKCDPRPVWKIWDEFGIQNAKMIGFWEDEPVITTNNKYVKATVYLKKGIALVSLGNFSDSGQNVKLNVDWQKLGFSADNSVVIVPAIQDFQHADNWSIDDNITIEPRKGILFFIRKKQE